MAFVGSLSGSGGASNTINVTGSIIIANPGTGGLFPAFPGTDAVFFVSGAIDGKAAGSRTVSVFGGDTVVSGSLTIGTGSIRIDSNEIRFQGGAAKITSGSGGLTFFDSGNSGGVTLASLAAGAGGGDVDGPSDSIDNSIARFDGTTGKLLTGSAITISDETGGGIAIAGSATATTISLFNTAATTVNFAGDATALAIGGGAGGTTTTIKGGALVGNTTTQAVFNTTATTVNFAQAATTITAGASGGSTTFQGNLTGSNVLASALTVTNGATFGDGFGSTGTSISADGNISTDGNVIVGGDLTVNGTTTTINTQNLLVEDPVILMASGAAGPNRDGGIAIFSGSADTTGPGARTELVFGRVANDTWGAGKINTANGTVTDLTGMSLLPVRASKFELGGATAFVTSSDGTNISITHGSTSTTTFTKAGTPIVQVGDYAGSGEGQIKGVTTANALSALWLSGSEINVGATSVAFLVNDVQQATITPLASGGGVRFEGQDGSGAPRAMVISGSQTTIGANSGLIVLERAGTTFMSASSNVGLNVVSLTPGAGFFTANLFNTVSTTVNLAQAATTINMGNVAGTNNVAGVTKFTQGLSGSLTRLTDGTSYLIAGTNVTIATGSNGAVTISTSGGGDVTGPGGSTDTAIARFNGLTGKIIQNTAGVTIDGSNNVVTSGSFSVKEGAGNPVVSIANTGVISGSSNILAGGGLTVALGGEFGGGATFGGGFGSTGVTITGTTGNISADGTLLIVGATTLSGSVILGDATGDDLTFNGYAASSLIPKTTNLYDLGQPDLRWRNMYTGDLHLKNERGDWTVIEEEDFLTLTNNKNGKRYKFVLEEI